MITLEDLKNNQNASSGLMTKSWGPAYWHVLYCFAGNSPINPTAQQQVQNAEFLKLFGRTLPCGKCRENFNRNTVDAGLGTETFASRDSLFEFVYKLHQSVSQKIHGEIYSLPFTLKDARIFIESLRAGCSSEDGCTLPLVRNGPKPACQMIFGPWEAKKSCQISDACYLTKSDA